MHALNWQEVAALVGPIDDDRITAIAVSGASLDQVAEAVACRSRGERPAETGPVTKVYDLLAAPAAMRER